jgi:hypothetical protein
MRGAKRDRRGRQGGRRHPEFARPHGPRTERDSTRVGCLLKGVIQPTIEMMGSKPRSACIAPSVLNSESPLPSVSNAIHEGGRRAVPRALSGAALRFTSSTRTAIAIIRRGLLATENAATPISVGMASFLRDEIFDRGTVGMTLEPPGLLIQSFNSAKLLLSSEPGILNRRF